MRNLWAWIQDDLATGQHALLAENNIKGTVPRDIRSLLFLALNEPIQALLISYKLYSILINNFQNNRTFNIEKTHFAQPPPPRGENRKMVCDIFYVQYSILPFV